MARKFYVGLLVFACLFTPALSNAAFANDVDDADFALRLLTDKDRGYLDLAKELAVEIRNRSGCSNEAFNRATRVLIEALMYEIKQTTDPAVRQRLDAQILELQNSMKGAGASGPDVIIQELTFKFKRAEQLADDCRNAEKKDQDTIKANVITAYDKLVADLKTRVEAERKTAAELDDKVTELRNKINKEGGDIYSNKEYENLTIAASQSVYLRNNLELLAGTVSFSYGLFYKNMGDAAKAEEFFNDAQKRMGVFVNGTDDDEIMERHEYKELMYDATILLGKAYMNLKKYKDAIECFEQMLDPPDPVDYGVLIERYKDEGKREAESLKARVRETRIEAHRSLTETYVLIAETAAGAEKEEYLKKADDTATNLFLIIPEAIKGDAGKATRVAQGKALMALNKIGPALIALNTIFASEEAARLGTAEKKFTPAQGIAAKEMSDIYDKAPKNLHLPSDVMFAIGMGYTWNKKFKEATYALRDAGRYVNTDLDRQHEEEALFNLGMSYYFMNAWYEATFAYIQIVEQYPNSRFVVEAVKNAKTCIKEAKPDHPTEKEIEKKVSDLFNKNVSVIEGQRSKLNDANKLYINACDLENNGIVFKKPELIVDAIKKFREATNLYLEVQEFVIDETKKNIPVDVYGDSRFYAGLCFMKAYMDSEIKESGDRDNAIVCYRQAVAWCEAQTAGSTDFMKKVQEIETKSRYRAAEFLMQFEFWTDKSAKTVAEEGLEFLSAFDTRLPGDASFMAIIRRIQVVGYLNTKQWDKADEKLKSMLQAYNKAKADKAAPEVIENWRKQFIFVAESLVNELNRWGVKNYVAEPEKAKEYWVRAAGYLLEWERIKLEGGDNLSFTDRLWMADIIFNSGKNDEAKKSYEKMIEEFKFNYDISKEEVKKAIERLKVARPSKSKAFSTNSKK